MVRKQVGRNTGQSDQINLSESEPTKIGMNIGDAVGVDVVQSEAVAQTLLKIKTQEGF